MSKRKKAIKIWCHVCGAEFMTDSYKKFTCSPVCAGARRLAGCKRANDRHSAEAKITKICAVCGSEFEILRCFDAMQKTCGKTCKRKLMSDLMKGRRTNERNFSAEDTLKAHIAQQSSPLCGRFDTHHSAKTYSLISPDGELFAGRNLRNFIRKNDFFWIEHRKNEEIIKKLSTQLSQLRPDRKHPAKSRHGWSWERLRVPNS